MLIPGIFQFQRHSLLGSVNICYPGDSTRSHSANKYIRPYEIRAAIDTYLHILQDFQF